MCEMFTEHATLKCIFLIYTPRQKSNS